MKLEPQKIKDKVGNTILIREGEVSDSENLQACVKSYLKSGFIPLTEIEFDELSQNHKEWIQKFKSGENDLLLVAEHKGQIIGNVDLMFNGRKMLNHVGYIGMGIHEEWQGRGIGRALLSIVLDWADKNEKIEALWLQVFSNNTKGLKLYSNMGFEKTGVQRNFIKTDSGYYVDNVIMTRNK